MITMRDEMQAWWRDVDVILRKISSHKVPEFQILIEKLTRRKGWLAS